MCCWWPYLTIIQLYEEKPQEESEPSEEDQQDERTEEEILGREMVDISRMISLIRVYLPKQGRFASFSVR